MNSIQTSVYLLPFLLSIAVASAQEQTIDAVVVLRDSDGSTRSVSFTKLSEAEQREALTALKRIHEARGLKVWTGTVVRAVDGDTIVFKDSLGESHRIRMDEIDAPESDQPFCRESTNHLAKLTKEKAVTLKWNERDRYGRIIGNIYVDDIHINAEMIKSGYAWFYVEYGKTPEFAGYEKKARQNKAGLWADADPIPPWEHRYKPHPLLLTSQPANEGLDPSKIYITKSGKKYHRPSCKTLKASAIPISLEDAKRRGYEPCGYCRP